MFVPDFVLDASITLSWAFEDESTVEADAVLERLRTEKAVVPPIWAFEVTNGLIVAERKGRIGATDTSDFLRLLKQLPILTDPTLCGFIWEDLAQLARETNLSAYDASYLYLAKLRGLPLATLDRLLAQAAKSHGVAVLP